MQTRSFCQIEVLLAVARIRGVAIDVGILDILVRSIPGSEVGFDKWVVNKMLPKNLVSLCRVLILVT